MPDTAIHKFLKKHEDITDLKIKTAVYFVTDVCETFVFICETKTIVFDYCCGYLENITTNTTQLNDYLHLFDLCGAAEIVNF